MERNIEKVRKAQLGLKLPNLVCVDAMGLPLNSDDLHLTTQAQVKLGKMLAEAYITQFLVQSSADNEPKICWPVLWDIARWFSMWYQWDICCQWCWQRKHIFQQ